MSAPSPTTPPVDRHRQRCYDAETAAVGGTLLDEPWPWSDLVVLLDRVLADPWWARWEVPAPHLRPGRADSRRSWSDGSSVVLAPDGRTPITLAHELAHHLVHHRWPGGAAHGPAFRAAVVRVLAVVGGHCAAEVLAAELVRWGVPPGRWSGPEPPPGPGWAEVVRLERAAAAASAAGPATRAIPLGPVGGT